MEILFGIVAHALQRMFENGLLFAGVGIAFHDAGQRGHFGDEALQDLRVIEQAHEAVHGLGRDLPPFAHDVRRRHVVQHARGAAHDGQPGIGLDGHVEIGGETQGPDGQQVVVPQGLVRQAGKAYGAGFDLGKAVIDAARILRRGAAAQAQGQAPREVRAGPRWSA